MCGSATNIFLSRIIIFLKNLLHIKHYIFFLKKKKKKTLYFKVEWNYTL